MSASPLPGAPISSTLAELRKTVEKIPAALRPGFNQTSRHTIKRSREPDSLPIYFVSDALGDLLLLSLVYNSLHDTSTTTGSTASRAVVVVVIGGWRDGTINKVIRTLEQHARRSIHETSTNSRIWTVKSASNASSRMLLTLGDPDQLASGDPAAYWQLVQSASTRVADLVSRVAKDAHKKRFVVYNTSLPVMLFAMPAWFWDCLRAVVMVNSISCAAVVDPATGRADRLFALSPALAAALPHFDCILGQAEGKFPIVHVDFSYSASGGGEIETLHSLPEFRAIWPKILHADAYAGSLSRNMDALYTSLIRLAASPRSTSAELCAENAEDMLKNHGGGRPWLNEAAKTASYAPDLCTLEATLPLIGKMRDLVDCPIDGRSASLAALIPASAPEMSDTEMFAARVAWKATDAGVKIALSNDSPQYLLLCMTPEAGRRVDVAVKRAWQRMIEDMWAKSDSAPRLTKPIAEGWRNFFMATKGLVDMLVHDEEKREKRKKRVVEGGEVKQVREAFMGGSMTAISKRSLA